MEGLQCQGESGLHPRGKKNDTSHHHSVWLAEFSLGAWRLATPFTPAFHEASPNAGKWALIIPILKTKHTYKGVKWLIQNHAPHEDGPESGPLVCRPGPFELQSLLAEWWKVSCGGQPPSNHCPGHLSQGTSGLEK